MQRRSSLETSIRRKELSAFLLIIGVVDATIFPLFLHLGLRSMEYLYFFELVFDILLLPKIWVLFRETREMETGKLLSPRN